MPTVAREDGFVVKVYGPPREHPPPHVHVERGGSEVVVIRLGAGVKPASVWRVHGMKDRDVVRAYRIVERHADAIRKVWSEIHG